MIKCRFAPSPTGFLHIGNVRTAIFNYLFAKHNNGEFHLRIEDTDKERSTQEAINVIFDGIKKMGLDYDGKVIYQSENINRHKEVVDILLASGKAYKCFHTPEELDDIRKENKNKVISKWRDIPEKNHPDSPFVVRIKSENSGQSSIDDMVQGKVTIKNSELDDMIILRSDGTPVYQLAVVVDDHDSGITHVIRGDDHLTNTFRQNMIYDAMNWDKPSYAHLPLIFDENGKKVSKRSGAASIVDFLDMGYLPEALLNYLVKLGWSNEKEILSKEELIKLFDFDHVGSSPSRLDYKKLNFINSWYIQNYDDELLTKEVIKNKDYNFNEEIILGMMSSLKVRAKTIIELVDLVKYLDVDWFNNEVISIPEKYNKIKSLITRKTFDGILKFNTNEDLMAKLKNISEKYDIKLKDLAGFVRMLLCKNNISPPLGVVINSLGEEECRRRYDLLYI